MEKLGKIRRLYYRDGLTVSEIVRRTGLARNTVKSWLKAAEGVVPKYRRRPAEDIKITPFAERLTKALEVDVRRPKRDRVMPIAPRNPSLPSSGDLTNLTNPPLEA